MSELLPVVTQMIVDPQIIQSGKDALKNHRVILEFNGIDDLDALGTLDLNGGISAKPSVAVTPSPGAPAPWGETDVPAFLPDLSRPGYTTLTQVKVGMPPGTSVQNLASPNRDVPIKEAYICATKIVFQPDTKVVLLPPHKHLVFIAREIEVGPNVVITWQPPVLGIPQPEYAEDLYDTQPYKPKQSEWHGPGEAGHPGPNGNPGPAGYKGHDGPEIQLWTLGLSGSPTFLVNGQDGTPGGRGQHGGKGGVGAKGRDEKAKWVLGVKVDCDHGPGFGAKGGPGGRAGDGGRGGDGGANGVVRMYAPSDQLLRYTSNGFTVAAVPGRRGAQGQPGRPGLGGDGGSKGHHKHCEIVPKGEERNGATGDPGGSGQLGAEGLDGPLKTPNIFLVPITQDGFDQELAKPALVSATPAEGTAGTQVMLDTMRVASIDILLMDDVPVPWQVADDAHASFTVPPALGGPRTLQIRQADGTLSNKMTFYVLPSLAKVLPEGRIRPGTIVTAIGSGFTPGSRVRVNGEDVLDSTYVDGTAMTFTLVQPRGSVAGNPEGEAVTCQVLLDDGRPTNAVEFLIDTLRILVIGDSVAWGQGLPLDQKFAEIVEANLAAPWPGIHRYTDFLAHSGATIGRDDNKVMPAVHPEVPTSYPTAFQQLRTFSGGDSTVDHVLITAGINDVNFRTIIDTSTTRAELLSSVDRYCREHLRDLLIECANRFPNATVVATGYFPILSNLSGNGLIRTFLASVGFLGGGAVGGLLGGTVGGAIGTDTWDKIVERCLWFHEMSTEAIARAVEESNLALTIPRVLFADPGFGPSNAALGPDPWLYGINNDMSPEDTQTSNDRKQACELHSDRAEDGFQCERASAGHPNPLGAAVYAEAITAELLAGPRVPMDDAAKLDLLKRYVPILKLHPDEPNKPSTVETFYKASTLRFFHAGVCDNCEILPSGGIASAADLLGKTHRTKNNLCNHVDNTRFSSSDPRDVWADEGFYLELDEAQRDGINAGLSDPAQWEFYGRVMPRNTPISKMFGRHVTALQYWFFYAYNKSPELAGIGFHHEGDWEHVTVILDNEAVKAVWFAAHNDPGTWAFQGDKLQLDGEHPIVYSARGTHASYPTAGSHQRPYPLPSPVPGTPLPSPIPPDQTGDGGTQSTAAVSIVLLGERSSYPAGQEWLAFGGLWGEVLETRWSSGPQGPAFQRSWSTY